MFVLLVCFLALPSARKEHKLKQGIIAILSLAALTLGGCASGNLAGGSALPAAPQMRHLDSVGGGLPGTIQPQDSVGGGLPGTIHPQDSVGGGLPGTIHQQDSVGGGLPGKGKHGVVIHRQDSVGGGLPGTTAGH